MGERVKVFTVSGTFKGQEGVISKRTRDGAYVRLDDSGDILFFTRGEIVPLESGFNIGGAE